MKRIVLFLSVIILAACSNGRIPPDEYMIDGTWSSVFKAYWHGMNDNYLYWNLDSPGYEWDEIYNEYLPVFEGLGSITGEEEKQLEAFHAFHEIASDLSDMHYSLVIRGYGGLPSLVLSSSPLKTRMMKNAGCTEDEIFLASVREYGSDGKLVEDSEFGALPEKFQKSEFQAETPENILRYTFGFNNYENLHEGTFKSRSIFPVSNTELFSQWYLVKNQRDKEPDTTDFAFVGITSDNIVYFLISSFMFRYYVNNPDECPCMLALAEFFKDQLLNQNTSGVIIDLRGNPGGFSADTPYLFGSLASDDFVYMKERIKTGDNRLDYSPWIPLRFQPAKETMDPDIPIAVLANNGSVSNSEVMLLIFRELQEKGRAIGIIGGSSAGAFGAVVDDDSVYNAGQFSVDPFITLVYTPSVQHAASDGRFYEGIGITPDIPIPFSYEDFTGNAGPDGNPAKEKYDARLNEAFDFIRNH